MGIDGGADRRQLDASLRTLYEHADLCAFPRRVLDAFAPLLPTEVTCYTELRPDDGSVRNVADRPDATLDALLPVLGQYHHQHARIAAFLGDGDGSARTISDYQSAAAFHRTDLYNGFYAPLGIEDQMALMAPLENGYLLGLAFNRSRRAFTERDRDVANLLRPHLRLAYANAVAVTRLRTSAAEAHGVLDAVRTGVVVLARGGEIRWASARGWSLLRDRFASPRDAAGAGPRNCRLPPALDRWFRSQAEGTAGAATAPVRRTARFRDGVHVVTARLVDDPARDAWTLLLDEEPPPAPDPLAERTAALPPRLRRVLDRFLAGRSEKEIAASLSLSPHTVHEYAKRLHSHFGVSSRSELLALWVRR